MSKLVNGAVKRLMLLSVACTSVVCTHGVLQAQKRLVPAIEHVPGCADIGYDAKHEPMVPEKR